MPLRDHFRPPLASDLEWHSFHNAWATFLAADINTRLPPGYRAAPNVQKGIEIDVATFRSDRVADRPGRPARVEWEPAAAVATIPFELSPPSAEVLVTYQLDGRRLAGAIELVSESNKDRPAAREALVAKCEGYLLQGAGVMIVDPVTSRAANLHDELMARLHPGADPWAARLYSTAYRPSGKNGSGQLAIWREELAVGRALPTMPLCLRDGPCVPVFLEETYEKTFRELLLTEATEGGD